MTFFAIILQTTWVMKSATSTYHCRVYFLILPLDALDLLLAVLVLLAVSEITLEVKVFFKISKVYKVLNFSCHCCHMHICIFRSLLFQAVQCKLHCKYKT